jgi:hypothetical protein
MFKPGVYDIPFEEYTQIEAVSNTALGRFAETPKTYKWWKDGGAEEKEPAWKKIGKLAHLAILQPDLFAAEIEKYEVQPRELKLNTKEGIAWKKEVLARGKQIIKADDEALFFGAPKAIAEHSIARSILVNGQSEQSVISTYNNIPIKCRPDFLTDLSAGGDTVVDIKTTTDARPDTFYWSDIIGCRYYRQGAFYLDGLNSIGLPYKHFVILAIEKKAPFHVSVHQITPSNLQRGRDEYVKLIGGLIECQRENKWPGYEEKIHPAPTPDEWRLIHNRVPDPSWMKEPIAA